MRTGPSLTFVAATLLALAGCGASPPRSLMPSADAALARMKASYACVNGVQGTAKIDRFAPEGRIRGEVATLAVNPARVRLDVVNPFGGILYTLTSNGTRFEMLDVKEKQFLYGPASACNLARLTQIPLPGHVLVSLLRGEAPVLVHPPSTGSVAWDSGGFYRVLVPGTPDATEEIHLEVRPDDFEKHWSEQRMRVIAVRVEQRGAELYVADLGHHEAARTAPPRVDPEGLDEPVLPSGGACDAELPRSLRMRVPSTGDDLILQYKDAVWNPPILPGAFTQPVPGGVTRKYVDCP